LLGNNYWTKNNKNRFRISCDESTIDSPSFSLKRDGDIFLKNIFLTGDVSARSFYSTGSEYEETGTSINNVPVMTTYIKGVRLEEGEIKLFSTNKSNVECSIYASEVAKSKYIYFNSKNKPFYFNQDIIFTKGIRSEKGHIWISPDSETPYIGLYDNLRVDMKTGAYFSNLTIGKSDTANSGSLILNNSTLKLNDGCNVETKGKTPLSGTYYLRIHWAMGDAVYCKVEFWNGLIVSWTTYEDKPKDWTTNSNDMLWPNYKS
jgi:hypothetical protein